MMRNGRFNIVGYVALLSALVIVGAPNANAAVMVFDNEAAYLGAINVDFVIDVGRDGAGNPLPGGTTQRDGTDIFGMGIDLDFSSPQGPNSTLVTTNPAHPELGPVGPNGQNWAGWLRGDFDQGVTAIGFGLHRLDIFDLVLLDQMGNETDRLSLNRAGFSFLGVESTNPFWGFVIETNNTFWSLDGGRTDEGWTSSTEMVGQLANVPEPGTVFLLGIGLLGYAARRRRA